VLQQRVKNAWQPLDFFSKKLNPGQQKYSAYDNELLAIYEAVSISATCWKRATSPSSPTTNLSRTPSSRNGTSAQ
jgi:hypothetical protein